MSFPIPFETFFPAIAAASIVTTITISFRARAKVRQAEDKGDQAGKHTDLAIRRLGEVTDKAAAAAEARDDWRKMFEKERAEKLHWVNRWQEERKVADVLQTELDRRPSRDPVTGRIVKAKVDQGRDHGGDQ